MTIYHFSTNINKEEYEQFVQNHTYCNLLQSYDWSTIKSSWDHLITGVYNEKKELVATGMVLIRQLPMGYTLFYIPRGPIMDYENKKLLEYYFLELKRIAKQRKCLFIKFDPAIHINDYASKDYNENRYPITQPMIDLFESIGAKHQGFTKTIAQSIQPRYQSNVYPTENWEENLPKHTKRLIKDANKRNVEIIHGQKEFVPEFSRLVALTEQRKQVALRNEEYFNLLMETYPEGGVIFLAQCNVYQLAQAAKEKEQSVLKELEVLPENAKKKKRRLEDQLRSAQKDVKEFEEVLNEFGHEDKEINIAGILSIQYGNTCEMLYAGMDERFKKFMPQYKEYVENFKWAFDRGCQWSNMGGVEGTLDDGLTKFKDNFNPIINEFIGEFDLPVNKILYPFAHKAYNYLKQKRGME